MHNPKDSEKYQKLKNRFFFVRIFIDFSFLLLLMFSGLTFTFRSIASDFSSNTIFLNGIYIFLFSLSMYIVHFPLNYFIGYIWEHKFKLSNQKFYSWLVDDLKKTGLGFIFILIFVQGIYWFLRKYPDNWWIGAGFFWLTFTYILAKLTPNVIIPIFYKYLPIENQELKEKIMDLFKSCNVKLKDVCAINMSEKTKKANAFLCGMGKSRKVVLSDTLLSNFETPEIEIVVAHELGHHKNKDIIKLLFINAISIFLGFFLVNKFLEYSLVQFGLKRIDDIAFFPMIALALMIFGFITAPIINGYSRMIEKKADYFSIDITGRPKDFISMIDKLGKMNLSEFQPSRFTEFFFYDHPPIYKRIKFAEQFLNSSE